MTEIAFPDTEQYFTVYDRITEGGVVVTFWTYGLVEPNQQMQSSKDNLIKNQDPAIVTQESNLIGIPLTVEQLTGDEVGVEHVS